MLGGNTNVSRTPFRPRAFAQSPQQPGYVNPFGFGAQRTRGQLAVQPNLPGMPTNSVPRVPSPTAPQPSMQGRYDRTPPIERFRFRQPVGY